MFKLTLLSIVFISLIENTFSQAEMNQWRIHYSLLNSVGITKTKSKIFMGGINGIVVYDTEDNSIDEITLVNGLSDINISAIGSNEEVLIVGYSNGNIDVITDNEYYNVPWLKKAQLSGGKTINNFYFYSDYVYISTDMGILVFDLKKEEIKDTYYPVSNSETIKDLCVFNDSLYVATSDGIYIAGVNQNYLNDFNNWYKKTNLPPSVVNSSIKCIEPFSSNLFFVKDELFFGADSIFQMNNSNQTSYFQGPLDVENIAVSDNELVVVSAYSVKSYNQSLTETRLVYQYNFSNRLRTLDAIKFNGDFWIADKFNGLVKAYDSYNNSQIFNNTPFDDKCYRVDIQYGKTVVTGGAVTQSLFNNYFRSGIYIFENEKWSAINYLTDTTGMSYNTTWDVISVSINPNNTSQVAIGTYSKGGLKIIENGKVTQVYTASNSLLDEQVGNNGAIIISDVKYDNDGNLWIVNPGPNPLKMLSKDGFWYAFNLGVSGGLYPYRLMIDSKGNKWVGFIGGGISVFNENKTFNDLSDDQKVNISTTEGYGNLPSSSVKAIAEDIDGEIWIGTEEGLTVLYSTDKLYNGEYGDVDANQIKLQYGENVEHLLGSSSISAIAVDGGNRKWVGTTSSGVFCFSPNGLEEIYRFTAENSPLLSNTILDIKINHLTGEVFITTENGLVSFRADATIGDEEFSNVTVFPNPVRPEFRGNITIQGLAYNSDVKITDVSGNLIYQTKSNGGTVLWDGNRLSGDRVQSGVYLIWTASSSGKGKNVAKVVVIN